MESTTTTVIRLMMIPATDKPIEMRPSFLARGRSSTAVLLARTVYKHTSIIDVQMFFQCFLLQFKNMFFYVFFIF